MLRNFCYTVVFVSLFLLFLLLTEIFIFGGAALVGSYMHILYPIWIIFSISVWVLFILTFGVTAIEKLESIISKSKY